MTAAPGPQQPDEVLTGQAFCTLCRARCGTCGCRMGGCFTEAWWAAQGRPAAPSAQPDEVCRTCGGEGGNHDGATHDAIGADLPPELFAPLPAQPVRDTGEGRR